MGSIPSYGQEPPPLLKQSAPSNDMDFVLPREANPDTEIPPPPTPENTVNDGGLLGDTSAAPGIDQFFSNTKVIEPEPKEEVVAPILAPVEEKKPEEKPKVVAKKKKPPLSPYNYKTVMLPEAIYHRPNGHKNRHLPLAFTRKDQQYLMAKAVRDNNVSSLRALSQNGASPHVAVQGVPLLVLAVQYGRVDAARWLLMNGVDVNEADTRGFTALHYASYSKNVALMSLLKLYGADTQLTDHQGYTPDDYSKMQHGNVMRMGQLITP